MYKKSFRELVSEEMVRVYGITWEDADGSDRLLTQAEQDGDTPSEFVSWFGKKCDLTPMKDW